MRTLFFFGVIRSGQLISGPPRKKVDAKELASDVFAAAKRYVLIVHSVCSSSVYTLYVYTLPEIEKYWDGTLQLTRVRVKDREIPTCTCIICLVRN